VDRVGEILVDRGLMHSSTPCAGILRDIIQFLMSTTSLEQEITIVLYVGMKEFQSF
jgi:hypothetical protein